MFVYVCFSNTSIYECMCACIHVSMHGWMNAWSPASSLLTCRWLCLDLQTYVHTYILIYILAHLHTYLLSYIYTPVPPLPRCHVLQVPDPNPELHPTTAQGRRVANQWRLKSTFKGHKDNWIEAKTEGNMLHDKGLCSLPSRATDEEVASTQYDLRTGEI